MESNRLKHFLVFMPAMIICFGLVYGAGFGAVGLAIDYLFIEASQSTYSDDVFMLILCLPFKIGIGLGIGLFAGVLISSVDSIFISGITFIFINEFGLWKPRRIYRNIIRVICILSNCLLGIIIFPSSSKWLILPIIIFATIVSIEHFLNWYFNYLFKQPKLLAQLAQIPLDMLREPTIWDEIHDLIIYKMSEIPDNLTQYPDGEIPAELLRQFPIDEQR